jgi:hypothetical protein
LFQKSLPVKRITMTGRIQVPRPLTRDLPFEVRRGDGLGVWQAIVGRAELLLGLAALPRSPAFRILHFRTWRAWRLGG